ncbi:MAG: hypothetical protein Q4C25_08550 [Bacillota bacterium]|nr:hypothetical protein [Bacillota bacterium]
MKNNWTTLDHAAKLFIAGESKTETQVFRFSCEFDREIDPALLQEAVDHTMNAFPSFRVVIKKGFFWYYLEECDLSPMVLLETKKLCANMNCTRARKLLLEVTYFRKRVNLEVYHVLADGTGAMQFFTTMLSKYSSLAFGTPMQSPDIDASHTQRKDDSYERYYTGETRKRAKVLPACRIQGFKYSENFLRNITGQLPAEKVSALAKEYRTTVTGLLCAFLIHSIGVNTSSREKKKPIILSVPVDLRNHFPSASARNFFGVISVSYQWQKEDNSIETIVRRLNPQFAEKLTVEYLNNQLDEQSAAEHNVFAKIAPLFLKQLALKIVYKNSEKATTATISNMGRISMPEEAAKHIKSFDICASTKKFQASICSFNGCLSIGCTNPHISSDIERTFFRMFTERDIDVRIMSNNTEDMN